MRRFMMLTSVVGLGLFAGCESTRNQVATTMPETQPETVVVAPAAQTASASAPTRVFPVPAATTGSILDRTNWGKTESIVPSATVPHFPVLLRDFETPAEKELRKPADLNLTQEQQVDRALDHSRAGNWNKANAKGAALQPIKGLYDIGVVWINLPIDLYHGVPQTPDPVSDKIRQEKCEFYP